VETGDVGESGDSRDVQPDHQQDRHGQRSPAPVDDPAATSAVAG